MHQFYLLFFGGFLISTILTRLLIRYAIRRELLDHPNDRSSHSVSTPRGGGLSIVLVSLGGLPAYSYGTGLTLDRWLWFLLPALVVSAVSYLDDFRDVHAKYRFLVHLATSLITVTAFTGASAFTSTWPLYASEGVAIAASILLLVWLLNLFNFMDGTDGIASVEALFISSSLLLLSGQLPLGVALFSVFNILIISSVAGFLLWNWPTAKIFMGDVGSSYLGFVLGVMGLYAVSQGWMTLWTVLILFGVFLVDATYTLLQRVMRGDRWYDAHRSHAYQKFSFAQENIYGRQFDAVTARAKAQRLLCYGVTAINLFWLLPMAWLSIILPQWGIGLMIAAFVPLVVLEIRYKAGVPI